MGLGTRLAGWGGFRDYWGYWLRTHDAVPGYFRGDRQWFVYRGLADGDMALSGLVAEVAETVGTLGFCVVLAALVYVRILVRAFWDLAFFCYLDRGRQARLLLDGFKSRMLEVEVADGLKPELHLILR